MTKINTAMILAAGFGTRMRAGAGDPPKPLTNIGSKTESQTLLDFILGEIIAADIKNIIINTHHKAEQIHTHLEKNYKHKNIIISHEQTTPFETGGGVRHALINNPALFSTPFLVCNADILWQAEKETIPALINKFNPTTMDALLLVAKHNDTLGFAPDKQADFILDNKNKLTRFTSADKADNNGMIFCGAQILTPQIFANIDEQIFSLNKIYDNCLKASRLYGHKLEGKFYHIGTPEAVKAVANIAPPK